eukprot:757086-Hanusia_phi.AAC.3
MQNIREIKDHVVIKSVFCLEGLAFAEPPETFWVLHAATRLGDWAQHLIPSRADEDARLRIFKRVPAGMGCNQWEWWTPRGCSCGARGGVMVMRGWGNV